MARVLLIDSGVMTSLKNWGEKNVIPRFIKDVRNLLIETRATKTILACDNGSAEWILSKFPDYKKARKEARKTQTEAEKKLWTDFYQQVNKFKELAPYLGIEVINPKGFEADFHAGYLCQAIDTTKVGDTFTNEILVLSNDHDWLTLLRPGIVLRAYNFKQNFGPDENKIPAKVWISTKKFIDAYGITPQQFGYTMAFSEDSDGLRTPYGLGKKSALELIRKYGSIAGVKENLHNIKKDIKGFRQSALDDLNSNFDNIYFNHSLVNLNFDEKTRDEIFPPEVQQQLNDVVSRLDEPPVISKDELEEYFMETGQINILTDFEEFLAPFRGNYGFM